MPDKVEITFNFISRKAAYSYAKQLLPTSDRSTILSHVRGRLGTGAWRIGPPDAPEGSHLCLADGGRRYGILTPDSAFNTIRLFIDMPLSDYTSLGAYAERPLVRLSNLNTLVLEAIREGLIHRQASMGPRTGRALQRLSIYHRALSILIADMKSNLYLDRSSEDRLKEAVDHVQQAWSAIQNIKNACGI